MKLYPLIAELAKQTIVSGVLAEDDEQATIEASFKVIELSSNNKVWAEGGITLLDPEGKILEMMPAK